MAATPSPSPRPSASIVIACVALTLSGIAVGVLIGRSLGTTTPVAHAEDGSVQQVDLGPVLSELRKIENLLARTPRSSESRSEQPSEPSTRAAVESYADRLDAEINRLRTEIDRTGEQRAATAPIAARWKGQGYPSLDAMFAFVVAGMKVPEGETEDSPGHGLVVGDEVIEELSRAHILWSRNEVLDRYGTPSRNETPAGGISYVYSKMLNPNRAVGITFFVKDGMVTAVGAE